MPISAGSAVTTNADLFRREFYSHTYNLLPSNLTVKTLFIEAYANECNTCGLVSDPQIMAKLCSNANCSMTLTNNSIKTATAVYADVSLFDPVLLFNYSIIGLQLFSNGENITGIASPKALNGGTTPGMQVIMI